MLTVSVNFRLLASFGSVKLFFATLFHGRKIFFATTFPSYPPCYP